MFNFTLLLAVLGIGFLFEKVVEKKFQMEDDVISETNKGYEIYVYGKWTIGLLMIAYAFIILNWWSDYYNGWLSVFIIITILYGFEAIMRRIYLKHSKAYLVPLISLLPWYIFIMVLSILI
ncbi:DUF4181 domain-containing protein [Halalkalibacter alkaliphilus]|uniref:DUF4181 domain-containing protein n=1 Tax=Halalkalibacter alkaliphilus TaxID=2917993 RepID=A0A9X2CWF0_9BACI|nr:DUF4181 domain-containing protein [Halalkalibacter alkaliphilus]MCL7749591.1 DUF4181 domain-containing protein [Halalkalibacter alkaliphilus]